MTRRDRAVERPGMRDCLPGRCPLLTGKAKAAAGRCLFPPAACL